MSQSYKRKCKTCGRWIQLRKMPNGNWVAFEGYDQRHKCSQKQTQPGPKKPDVKLNEARNIFDNIDFVDFNMPQGAKKAGPSKPAQSVLEKHIHTLPEKKSESGPVHTWSSTDEGQATQKNHTGSGFDGRGDRNVSKSGSKSGCLCYIVLGLFAVMTTAWMLTR